MKKENRTCFILWTIAAIAEFVSAIIGFITENGVISYLSLVLGFCFLTFAIMYFGKYKKEK